LYRKATFLTCVTEGIRKELIKKGIPAEGVRTITTACDLALFTPDGPQEDLETLTNIPADAFLCIHTGSLGFANSLDFVVDGAERVRDDPSIHFLLVGNGPEKPRLMSEVSRRNLRNVHFLSPVPKATLPRFLRRADLGILCIKPSPLTYIFLQNKFFDYLACGCPVIVNFEGEAREYVEPVNAGIFVPPGDVEAFSSAIRNLAANRGTARNMRTSARQLAERNFSWDYKAADYRDVISSVVTEDAAADLAR
jgi:colanic acid biosynthesis glycosyl transferase WcaI